VAIGLGWNVSGNVQLVPLRNSPVPRPGSAEEREMSWKGDDGYIIIDAKVQLRSIAFACDKKRTKEREQRKGNNKKRTKKR
jgi:hypothetical protein